MVDFKKMMNTCYKDINPNWTNWDDRKTCKLLKGHDGECKDGFD